MVLVGNFADAEREWGGGDNKFRRGIIGANESYEVDNY